MYRLVSMTGMVAALGVAGAVATGLSSDEAEVVEVEITAARFHFTPDVVTVPEGARVRLIVASADVIHGFEIREFGINEIVRRRGLEPAVIEFTADRAGRFEIVCSEDCGEGHDDMKGTLIVEARSVD